MTSVVWGTEVVVDDTVYVTRLVVSVDVVVIVVVVLVAHDVEADGENVVEVRSCIVVVKVPPDVVVNGFLVVTVVLVPVVEVT